MAIVVRLEELLHTRRMTLTEFATRVDITVANLSILKTGKAKAVRFSTLEAICAAFPGGDFFAWPLLALGVTGSFSLLLAARGLWQTRRDQAGE